MSLLDFDQILMVVGERGKYQTVMFIILCIPATIPVAFLAFSNLFTTATPDHWCRAPPEFNNINVTDSVMKYLTIPKENGSVSYSKCTMYDVNSTKIYDELFRTANPPDRNKSETIIDDDWLKMFDMYTSNGSISTRQCNDGWEYDRQYYDKTLVTEFNLVCEDSWSPQTSTALFYVGSLFGSVFFGWVADRWGRRTSMLWMIVLEVLVSIVTSYSNDYKTYLAMRVVGGLFFPALYQIPFILGIEMMAPKHRPLAGMIICIMFAASMSLLALLAFLLRDWFKLSIATSVPFIILYSYYWIIPESPRWLVSKGRIDEANQVIQKMARYNGVVVPNKLNPKYWMKYSSPELDKRETKISCNTNGDLIKPNESMLNTPSISVSNDEIKTKYPNQYDELQYRDIKENIDPWNNQIKYADKSNQIHDDKESTKRINNDNIEIDESIPVLGIKSIDREQKLHIDLDGQVTYHNNKCTNEDENDSPCLLKSSVSLQTDLSFTDTAYKDATLLDIFYYPNIRKKFLLLTYIWIANAIVYNGLSYNATNLGVNDFLAFFVSAVIEIPSNILAWKLMDIWGRKWLLCLSLGIGGLGCLACMFISEENVWVMVSFAMIGKFGVAASFSVFYVFVGESFPTVIRSQAMAFSSLLASVGLLMFPYILEMAMFSRVLPMVVLGILSISGSIATIFLPDTLDVPMPQTLEDGENYGKDFSIFSLPRRKSNRQT